MTDREPRYRLFSAHIGLRHYDWIPADLTVPGQTLAGKKLSPPRDGHQVLQEGTTAFVRLPILSTHTSMTSPGFRYCGGFIPKPTPGGVPVKIMSPGSRVT